MLPNDGSVPVSPTTKIPGWEEEAEENTLSFYASQVPDNGLIVEIGAEYGRSAGAFLSGSATSKVMSVDLFPKDHFLVGDLMVVYEQNIREAGFSPDRFEAIRGNSSAVGAQWDPSTKIDLLFIDGDHTYEGVVRDIETWAPLVGLGGVVAFHDVAIEGKKVHPLHHEVLRAIKEKIHPMYWAFETQVESLQVYRRLNIELPE